MVIVAFQGKQIETPDPTLPPPSVSEYLKSSFLLLYEFVKMLTQVGDSTSLRDVICLVLFYEISVPFHLI